MALDPLVLAYLETQPEAAAAHLARLDTAELTAFLTEAPPAVAAGLLPHMRPTTAAEALARTEPEVAAAVLARVPNEAALAVLRTMSRERRAALYRTMPRHATFRLRLQLRYPESLIGSFTDPDAVTLAPELRVADALTRLRTGSGRVSHQAWVLDVERRLAGYVELTDLVATREWTPLTRLVRPVPLVLNARAPLHAVADLGAWQHFDSLPVLDRRGRFQGVLRREALDRRDHTRVTGVSRQRELDRTRGALADVLWIVLGALFAPRERPSAANREDD